MKAKARYDRKNYDRIVILLPRGSREIIKAKADSEGLSVNRYLGKIIEQGSGLKLTLDNTLPWLRGNNE